MKKAWLCAAPLLAAGSGPAHAHSSVPGIEGFYVGLLHPFSTPAQALLILGLGLFAGGFEPARARWLLGAFFTASLFGLFLGNGVSQLDASMFAIAFFASAWAALGPGRLLAPGLLLAAIGGVLIGILSVPDDGPTRDRLITMAGSIAGANTGLLYLFGVIMFVRERFTRDWIAIAVRVLSAWVGAISLVMLALHFAASQTAIQQ